jgi:hypothetical protein
VNEVLSQLRAHLAQMAPHQKARQAGRLLEVSKSTIEELLSLVDGCYEVVELWPAASSSQIEWKKRWLERARRQGASGE